MEWSPDGEYFATAGKVKDQTKQKCSLFILIFSFFICKIRIILHYKDGLRNSDSFCKRSAMFPIGSWRLVNNGYYFYSYLTLMKIYGF